MTSWLKQWQFWLGGLIVSVLVGSYYFGSTIQRWAAGVFTGAEHSALIVMTDIFGFIFGVFLLALGYYLGSSEPNSTVANSADDEKAKSWRIGRNLFVICVGMILGWGIAMAYTPFGTADAESLNTIMKTLSVFVSGYLVSKVDRFLEGTLFKDKAPTMQWVPLGLFFAGFLLSMIVVFVNRMYTHDLTRSALSFNVPAENSDLMFGDDKISINDGKLSLNGIELAGTKLEKGQFVKIYPHTRTVEVNGRGVGIVDSPTNKTTPKPVETPITEKPKQEQK